MAGQAKKILIIVYYWPPSGGSGVQRWVKLSKYLADLGFEVHVLTVNERYASYLQIDESLNLEVDPRVIVHKTRSFEVINLFARIFGKKKVPTAGFYNLDKKSLTHQLGLIIRSNLFIPDPRRGWNGFAYKKACKIIEKEHITKVITSTPPHSSQLVGLKLKMKYPLEWIADLRDPWTDIFYYKILRHSFLSKKIDKSYEKKVLINADQILTVSKHLKDIFISKSTLIIPEKIHLIPNGYDDNDFEGLPEYKWKKEFTIGYTGTISEQYDASAFFKAFKRLAETGDETSLELTGTISPVITRLIGNLGIEKHVRINPAVEHGQIPGLIRQYGALLLVIPHVEHSELILTGKLFEYLAARRPVVLIGPKDGDAAKILTECGAGYSFDWNDEDAIYNHLIDLKQKHDKKELRLKENKNLEKYSRSWQAQMLADLLTKNDIA